jgi:hypothetical protein
MEQAQVLRHVDLQVSLTIPKAILIAGRSLLDAVVLLASRPFSLLLPVVVTAILLVSLQSGGFDTALDALRSVLPDMGPGGAMPRHALTLVALTGVVAAYAALMVWIVVSAVLHGSGRLSGQIVVDGEMLARAGWALLRVGIAMLLAWLVFMIIISMAEAVLSPAIPVAAPLDVDTREIGPFERAAAYSNIPVALVSTWLLLAVPKAVLEPDVDPADGRSIERVFVPALVSVGLIHGLIELTQRSLPTDAGWLASVAGQGVAVVLSLSMVLVSVAYHRLLTGRRPDGQDSTRTAAPAHS